MGGREIVKRDRRKSERGTERRHKKARAKEGERAKEAERAKEGGSKGGENERER